MFQLEHSSNSPGSLSTVLWDGSCANRPEDTGGVMTLVTCWRNWGDPRIISRYDSLIVIGVQRRGCGGGVAPRARRAGDSGGAVSGRGARGGAAGAGTL